MRRFVDRLNRRPAAEDAAIAESEKQLAVKLPAEYVEFLKLTNGGEGFIGRNYAILWRVEELASMNESYEVRKYAPGLLIFGSSGGGEAYGFDARTPQWPIVQVPFVGMDWDYADPMGESFNAFLGRLHGTE
jgi:SMI1/KNR4 family protein SUKH-1